jgi:hypothetical protein
MAKKSQTGTTPPIDLDLRAQSSTGPLSPDGKRFDIFLIDTGWNEPISKVVRSQLRLLSKYKMTDDLYELTPEQSAEVVKHDPTLIGCDPTIIFYDRYRSAGANAGTYRGFRLNLGLMRHPEQALIRLQEIVRFVVMHRTSEHLDREIRRELHREGFDGFMKLLRETSAELLGE